MRVWRLGAYSLVVGIMILAGQAHALSDTEKNAVTLGRALAAGEYCKLSNTHQQLMWTEAQATLSQQARNDRELERAQKQLNKAYEKNRREEPKGGCRNFVNNNPDPSITTMKTVQQLRQKFDNLNKVIVDQNMNQNMNQAETDAAPAQ